MSALHGIWRTLDLAPTGDTAAIRKAYARALKTFDMDEEPARYIALREARDAAIAQAPYFDADTPLEEEEEEEEDWVTADALPAADAVDLPDWEERWSEEDLAEDPRWQPETPGTPPVDPGEEHDAAAQDHVAAMQEHYDAVLAMLFPGDERGNQSLDRIAASVLAEHVTILLTDPRLEELVFHAEAERWFAHVIASSPLRSDPILTQVIGHFGWLASRGRIDQSPAVAAVVARYDALVFVTELQNRKHPLHNAWLELRKPAFENSRKSFGVRGSKVRELLGLIRTHHPTLEPQLDTWRVALWEKPSGISLGWGNIGIGLWLIFMVVRLISYGADPAPPAIAPPPVAAQYLSPEIMLDPMLTDLGGSALTLDTMRDKNPKLHQQLRTNWTLAIENGKAPSAFVNDMRDLLIERYSAGVRRAPHDILVDLARLRLDKARLLRVRGWEACDDFFQRGIEPPAWLNADMPGRRKALIARVLLEVDGDAFAAPPSNTFKVDGAIVDAASKRAGIPRADFVKAMVAKGTAENRCKTATALLETALMLPGKQGDLILRNL
ncbi:hypothetical protein [Sphingomonas endolithica]|uniref:hypothetical protein n=1 Tax=Sphingomonas endolithica TaxID=2972485 RepID=UPI0021AEF9BB|nr:hypothetical protein [Sphingomonas sp. ZFBP2030]